ncbi:MAG: DUF4493 domain-containing protein [Lachnoclostridium sp.]|nr:DUF4493 domain-containing protein [Lachnoclostridium sp.]
MTLNLRKILYLLAAMLFVATACDDDSEHVNTGYGQLSISIEPQTLAMLEDGSTVALPAIDLPDTDNFTLKLSDSSGAYAKTWSAFGSFIQNDRYFTGGYEATVSFGNPEDEGFISPCYYGNEKFTVASGKPTEVTLRPGLASAIFNVTLPDNFRYGIMLNTSGGMYYTFNQPADKLLSLRRGTVYVAILAPTPDGRKVVIPVGEMTDVKAGYYYDLIVTSEPSADADRLTITAAGCPSRDDMTISITDQLLSSSQPAITWSGLPAGNKLALLEGQTTEQPLVCTITGLTPTSKVTLSTISASLADKDFPSPLTLTSPSIALNSAIALGLKVNTSDNGSTLTVDFTDLLARLIFTEPDQAVSRFAISAATSGVAAEPSQFEVVTTPAEIVLDGPVTALAGSTEASMTVITSAPRLAENIAVEISTGDDLWTPAPITSITDRGDSRYDVTFTIPPGLEPLTARILYCEEVRTTIGIVRSAPDYGVTVDAFASHAVIRIDTPDDDLRRYITTYLPLEINGSRASVFSRDVDNGLVTIIGLTPHTSYNLTASLLASPTQPEISTRFTTENADNVPNGDFEDWDESLKYSNMPSGGRYAQNSVEIFNRQHFTSFKLSTPKKWANVNAKTFCLDATNINTWYLQPSTFTVDVNEAYSGGYAVELVSTAWDIAGPDIPEYLPLAPPYPDYSLNIPAIANRAAGKLFLGDYTFDPATGSETYSEGISWETRPSALNGFYHYEPSAADRSDHALVTVELSGMDADGREVVIASSTARLAIATSYTSFNIPLTYPLFGIKATKLKIMFSSSESPGSIDHERATVMTFDDPVTSTSTGSRLWLDNLQFAY